MATRYTKATAVTTSDTDTTLHYSAFMVSGAGNVKVQTWNGDIVTVTGAVVGTVYPIAVKQIFATLTTATGIIGLEF